MTDDGSRWWHISDIVLDDTPRPRAHEMIPPLACMDKHEGRRLLRACPCRLRRYHFHEPSARVGIISQIRSSHWPIWSKRNGRWLMNVLLDWLYLIIKQEGNNIHEPGHQLYGRWFNPRSRDRGYDMAWAGRRTFHIPDPEIWGWIITLL